MTGIYAGSSALTGIYAGSTPVSAVYAGTTQIWPMTETIGPPVVIYDDPDPAVDSGVWSTNANTTISVIPGVGIRLTAIADGAISGYIDFATIANIVYTYFLEIGSKTVSGDPSFILTTNLGTFLWTASITSTSTATVLPDGTSVRYTYRYASALAGQYIDIKAVSVTKAGLIYIDPSPATAIGDWTKIYPIDTLSVQADGIRCSSDFLHPSAIYHTFTGLTIGVSYSGVMTGGTYNTPAAPNFIMEETGGTDYDSKSIGNNAIKSIPFTTTETSAVAKLEQSGSETKYITMKQMKFYQNY